MTQFARAVSTFIRSIIYALKFYTRIVVCPCAGSPLRAYPMKTRRDGNRSRG